MKYLPIGNAEPGMILGEDLFGKFDLLYASKGDMLTDKLIDGLKRMGTEMIGIEEAVTPNGNSMPLHKDGNSEDPLSQYRSLISEITKEYRSYTLLNRTLIQINTDPMAKLMDLIHSDCDLLRILSAVSALGEYTLKHSIHVSVLASYIGHLMALSSKDCFALAYAGLLHDAGKTRLSVETLNKAGFLSADEFAHMKDHSRYSCDLIDNLPHMNGEIQTGILHHHERRDGSGYPAGLENDAIHIYGQILSVADTYSAMTSHREFQKKSTPIQAAEEIFNNSCASKLNPEIANLFLKQLYQMLIGTQVHLSNGIRGEIIYLNRFSPTRPLIKTDDGFVDLCKEYTVTITEVI